MGVLKMVSQSLALFSTVLIASATAATLRNYTITVPAGTSDHGDPKLICTPAGWQDIITFYLGNYIAHVATVISLPGESTKSRVKVSIAALLFPISGLIRGLGTILTFSSFANTDLQKAARARALCMVVRNQDWKPEPGDIVTNVFVEDCTKSLGWVAAGSSRGSARVVVVDAPWFHLRTYSKTPVAVNPEFTLHGAAHMPASKGYDLAYVSGNAVFEDDFISNAISPSTAPTVIGSSYNMIGGLIALAQAIYTSVTLYQTRGDQINQYGCAAFGLTVAPFVLMSIINLIANIFAPSYSAIYMVETSVMEEARRHGCSFSGVVGKIKEGRGALLNSRVPGGKWVESATFEKTGENAHLSVDIFQASGSNVESSDSQELTQRALEKTDNIKSSGSAEIVVQVKEQRQQIRELTIQEEGKTEKPEYIIGIPSCPLSDIINSAARKRSKSLFVYVGLFITRILNLKETILILSEGKGFFYLPAEQNEEPERLTPPKLDAFTMIVNKDGSLHRITADEDNYDLTDDGIATWGMLLGFIPIIIVGGLSHFKMGYSTVAQRAWTMSWLGSGVIAGMLMSGATKGGDKGFIQQHTGSIAMVGHILMFGAPAIGGFVVVGQMVKEYGSCISLP